MFEKIYGTYLIFFFLLIISPQRLLTEVVKAQVAYKNAKQGGSLTAVHQKNLAKAFSLADRFPKIFWTYTTHIYIAGMH